MKRYGPWILVALAVVVLIPLLNYFFRERSDIRADVLRAANRLGPDDDLSGGGGGADSGNGNMAPDLLGPDDAAFLHSAKTALQELALPPDRKTHFVEDALAKRLFAEAERRNLVPEGAPGRSKWSREHSTFAMTPFDRIPLLEREEVGARLEMQIHEVGERIATALSEQAILKHLEAEAELRVRHRDLQELKSARTKLPADAIGLLPPDQLDLAIRSFRPLQRALEERLALNATADLKTAVEHLQQRIDAYQAAREAPGYAEFHNDTDGYRALSRDVPKEKWDVARADFDTRVKAEASRLKAQEAAIPAYRPTVWLAQQQRGPPPDSSAARIIDAIRCYDLEVHTAIRSQARIEAVLSSLRTQLRGDHPLFQLDGYQRLLATLDSSEFHQVARVAREAHDAQVTTTPASLERDFFLKGWAEAVEAEAKRRGGNSGSSQGIEIDAAVTDIVDHHLKGRDEPLTPEAEAKFLATSQLRFSDSRTMPLSVRDEVDKLVNRTLEKYQRQLESARKNYERFAERAATATSVIDPDIVGKLREYKGELRQAVREFGDYVETADERQLKIKKEVYEELAVLKIWFFGPESPPPTQPAEGPTPPPKGPPNNTPPTSADSISPLSLNELEALTGLGGQTDGANSSSASARRGKRRYLLAADPVISRTLDRLDELSGAIDAHLKSSSTEPPKFGMEKGRYTVSRAELKPELNLSQGALRDQSKNRLPDSQADWEGRLKPASGADSKKVPYNFEKEVWKFKEFRPVGGGIHFGSTGTATGNPLSQFVLSYDRKREELILTGPAPEPGMPPAVFRLDNVRPEVLKPLYQFVSGGRNAAISIGWGTTRSSGLFDRDREQAVLLDPFLIDTPIGQDLILADSIPWSFEKREIGGKEFYNAFAEAKAQTNAETEGLLDEAVKNLPPYQRLKVNEWARATPGAFIANEFGILSRAITQSVSVEEAREAYYAEVGLLRFQQILDAGLNQEKLPVTKSRDRDELLAGARRLVESGKVFRAVAQNRFESPDDYAARAVPKMIELQVASEKDDAQKLVASEEGTEKNRFRALMKLKLKLLFPKDQSGANAQDKANDKEKYYDSLILNELSEHLQITAISPQGCDVGLLRNWISARLATAKPQEREQLRKDLLSIVIRGHTSLAVLMDVPGKTSIEFANGKIDVRVELKYQYARTRVTIQQQRVYFGKTPADDRDVDSLDKLNQLVNDHYADISREFAPLQRVERYAQLAAFLRWANQAKQEGKLGGVDFSELADFPARDRAQFPTPDVLIP